MVLLVLNFSILHQRKSFDIIQNSRPQILSLTISDLNFKIQSYPLKILSTYNSLKIRLNLHGYVYKSKFPSCEHEHERMHRIQVYIHTCVYFESFLSWQWNEYIIDNLLFGFDTFKKLLHLRYIYIYISRIGSTYQNSN